ncbi:ROK family transcriptional regulator [Alicyclobacillus sp. SO9]|uniref:ROK family transcriptional regulator n=1 Tax=Alicyclobacillus sp. SO9 TaxID=2665646 RepID=UPI0018E74FC7|nr:ROK family transcriptional regulator [Alicyclobacillus sp. SO9]QQE79243.1 ROK family transcriptional regulator [Alicyclobacillus sp. SO9]
MDAANNVILHDINTNSIFRLVQHQGPVSRVEISERTGLAASTVSMITGELQGNGFIRECGYATSTGGRRPRLLEINPDGGYFLCVDLAGSNIAVGVLNLSFELVHEWSYEKTMASGESLYREMVKSITEVLTWCNENTFKVISLGVAAPGLMNADTGKIVEASNLNWHDLKLNELLEQEFHLPVIVENDTNAAAYGEFLYGSENASKAQNMMYIAVGTGVGGGLIIGRELYKGSQGMAGEIGHVVVQPNGQLCSCGKKGCLETLVSESSLLREYNHQTQAKAGDIEELLERAEAGDALANTVFTSAGATLGMVVGNQVNILNLDSVVFGGQVIARVRPMFETIVKSLNGVLLPGFESNLEVRVSSLSSSAGYAGIAYSSLTSVMDKYGFKHPVMLEGTTLYSQFP